MESVDSSMTYVLGENASCSEIVMKDYYFGGEK